MDRQTGGCRGCLTVSLFYLAGSSFSSPTQGVGRKAEAIRNFQTLSIATLVPDREESVEFDVTENLFIEGGNLKVLTLL